MAYFLAVLTVNSIFPLNILLGCVPRSELRSIILKLEIELEGATVNGAVREALGTDTDEPRVLGAEYEELNAKCEEPTYEEE